MIGNACLNSANECGKTVFLRPAPTAIRCGMLWSSCLKEGLADVDDRFSASSDTARDLQHHRLPDARRFLYRSGSEADADVGRSEEHTSELQSHLISYAVFCLKKKKKGQKSDSKYTPITDVDTTKDVHSNG